MSEVKRHKTAIRRYHLSAPMKALWNVGFLEGQYSVFDYGCGRGDDLELLKTHTVKASGWDPHFCPDNEKQEADIVNLGFVLNVIENPIERTKALRAAFQLTNSVLSIAVMIGGRSAYEQYKLYNDGILTTRGTFQKYYTQKELKTYVHSTLGVEPISIAPGVVFVFKSHEAEQAFLFQKQSYRRRLLSSLPKREYKKIDSKWETHKELIDDFWACCLRVARVPLEIEFPRLVDLREKVSTPNRVYKRLIEENGIESLQKAQEKRREDILVYLALNFFERRKSYKYLPISLKKDIRVLFSQHKAAEEKARELLFSIGDPTRIYALCQKMTMKQLGFFNDSKNWYISSHLIQELHPILRVYIGCSSVLYGDAREADVICLYPNTSQLCLQNYDDFKNKKIPKLIERIIIDFRRQKIKFVDYSENEKQKYLFLKSRYLHKQDEGFLKQLDFDKPLIKYIGERRLDSQICPSRVIDALPKSYKRKYAKALDIDYKIQET